MVCEYLFSGWTISFQVMHNEPIMQYQTNKAFELVIDSFPHLVVHEVHSEATASMILRASVVTLPLISLVHALVSQTSWYCGGRRAGFASRYQILGY